MDQRALDRLKKAVDNIRYIGDVYAFTLPKGEVYNTEPFGECGPIQFVHYSVSELKAAYDQVRAEQKKSKRVDQIEFIYDGNYQGDEIIFHRGHKAHKYQYRYYAAQRLIKITMKNDNISQWWIIGDEYTRDQCAADIWNRK